MLMYSGVEGGVRGLTEVKTTIDIAVVGPEIRWNEEPKRAAIMAGTIAEYKPYSGGRPAIIAKATPCGRTMTAPVSPAMRSARIVLRLTMLFHWRKGKNFSMPEYVLSELSSIMD